MLNNLPMFCDKSAARENKLTKSQINKSVKTSQADLKTSTTKRPNHSTKSVIAVNIPFIYSRIESRKPELSAAKAEGLIKKKIK